MQSTDFTSSELGCALYYPEQRTVKDETEELRCCLREEHFMRMKKLDMCGTVACPFFKPNGKGDHVRKERGDDVYFADLTEEQKAKQMNTKQYSAFYEGVINEKRAKGKAERFHRMADKTDPGSVESR